MLGDPKKTAAMIVVGAKEPDGDEASSETEDGEDLSAAEDFLKAVKRGDAGGVKKNLKLLMETCYPELGGDEEEA